MTKQKTFKPVPPALTQEESAEVLRQERGTPLLSAKLSLVDKLAALKGMNRELAEHMVSDGIPNDAVIIQQRYGLEVTTAAEILAMVKEV